MNIYEYIENSKISYPFMSDSFLNTTVDNPTSTAEFQELLKNYIYENFGIYQISPLIVMRENSTEKTFDDLISEISTLVYKANEYRYNTLYSTIIQEYDPIENYKMVENIIVNYKGSEKNINNFLGKEKNSVEYVGREKNSTNYLGNETITDTKSGSESNTLTKSGSESNTLTKSGSESNTLTKSGSENVNESATRGDITTTTKKAPFDSENFYNESQDLTSQSNEDITNTTTTFTDRADINTTNFIGRTDTNTTTFTNRTDTNTTTFTNRADTNTTNYNNVKNDINKSFNERKDENIKEFENRNDTSIKEYENRTDENIKTFTDREDVTTHTRSGNIGVTTSQQMLESERMIANFKFVDIVARDIVKKIAILLY